jgi:hypothetical protein
LKAAPELVSAARWSDMFRDLAGKLSGICHSEVENGQWDLPCNEMFFWRLR